MSRRLALATLVATLAMAPPALAIPGDPLPQAVNPADGGTVQADPDGITFTFTCPAYRNSPSSEVASDDIVGYGVDVTSDPAGRMPIASGRVERSTADPSQCTAVMKGLATDRPNFQDTPGTYYWVVSRTCFCGGGVESESGPVARFTINAAPAKLSASLPSRIYAGYPFRATLSTDLADGQVVSLERRVGSAWKALSTPSPVRVSDGKASTVVTLAAGKQQLRWVVARGTQTDTGAPAKATVVKARSWSTSRRDVGRYRGSSSKSLLQFRVAGNGRELRDFRAQVAVSCIGSSTDVTKNYVTTAIAGAKRIKVAPDGRFLAVSNVSKTTAILSGRLRRGRVTGGRIELSYPLCSGSRTFSAAKR